MDPAISGQPVEVALGIMGAPTGSYRMQNGMDIMSWTRNQSDHSFGMLSCTETITVSGGIIRSYERSGGNCGN